MGEDRASWLERHSGAIAAASAAAELALNFLDRVAASRVSRLSIDAASIVVGAVTILAATLWIVYRGRRALRLRMAPTPEARAAATPSHSPPPPPAPPAFHAYTSDEFEGLAWRWRWRPGVTFVRGDLADDLAACCPKCGLQIVPTEWWEMGDPFPGPSQRRELVYRTRFRCDDGCTDLVISGSKDEIESRIRRRIEREALARA